MEKQIIHEKFQVSPDAPKHLSVEDLSIRWYTTPRQINKWVREGKLSCLQLSAKHRIFTEAQILAFEESRTRSPEPIISVSEKKPLDNHFSRALPSRATSSNKPRNRRENQSETVLDVESKGKSDKAQILKEMRQWR